MNEKKRKTSLNNKLKKFFKAPEDSEPSTNKTIEESVKKNDIKTKNIVDENIVVNKKPMTIDEILESKSQSLEVIAAMEWTKRDKSKETEEQKKREYGQKLIEQEIQKQKDVERILRKDNPISISQGYDSSISLDNSCDRSKREKSPQKHKKINNRGKADRRNINR